MKKTVQFVTAYLIVLCLIVATASLGSKTVTNMAAHAPLSNRKCVVIDAGHGGVDGGATSCTGILECHLNLEIATRLNDLLHLLGISTLMIRTDDRSVYTSGQTIAAKKVSDLKERVRVVNTANNAVLVSIHQNHFVNSQYHGAQVFYAATDGSKELANTIQNALKTHLNKSSNRSIKKAQNIFLLENVKCTGVLIECGFLSNPIEEAKLKSSDYQKKVCCVIGSSLSTFFRTLDRVVLD